MSEPAHPRRTTAVVGLLLALLLVGAYAVTTWSSGRSSATPPVPAVPVTPTAPAPTPSPAPLRSSSPAPSRSTVEPRPGPDYPVSEVGALGDRTAIVDGHGNADLRYRRAPRNATRLHFICTGCDAGTRLVEWPRGVVGGAVGGGRPADPGDVTRALDVVAPAGATSLLVEAPATAQWIVTLTPFDLVPVHEQTFDALGDDVVAVRTREDLLLSCGGALRLSVLARAASAAEYVVVQRREDDDAGRWRVPAPRGGDLVVLAVSCPGRWTVTVP